MPAELTGHTDRVEAVAIAADGSWLASAGQDGTVRIWDPTTGAEASTLTTHGSPVRALVAAPDGATGARGWVPDPNHPVDSGGGQPGSVRGELADDGDHRTMRPASWLGKFPTSRVGRVRSRRGGWAIGHPASARCRCSCALAAVGSAFWRVRPWPSRPVPAPRRRGRCPPRWTGRSR